MKYVIKYYHKSKYLGMSRYYYKEFNEIIEVLRFIKDNKIEDYELYEKIMLPL